MDRFFENFLEKHQVTAAQCAVLLHTVSITDSKIIEIDRDAARAYASFHELPLTQRHRFRSSVQYVFAFLATHDRYFVLNDVYAFENSNGKDVTQRALQDYQRSFPHNVLAENRNHVGYILRPMDEGEELRGRILVRKPASYTQGYVFYTDRPACHAMLASAETVPLKLVDGPMDSVIQMPLPLIAKGLANAHFADVEFRRPGVYLLRHIPTGGTYVGSASGSGGLADRWRYYVETVHGDNKELVELVGRGATAVDFTVTALEVTADRESALRAEQLWKQRLMPTLNKN